MNKQAILEPVAVLLPIKKDSFVTKLATSNVQTLTSHNAILPLTMTSVPLTEVTVSASTRTAEQSEERVTQPTTLPKHGVQNSQNFNNVN